MPKPIMPIFFIKIILTYIVFQILEHYIKFLNILKLLGVRNKFFSQGFAIKTTSLISKINNFYPIIVIINVIPQERTLRKHPLGDLQIILLYHSK
jgi:hypothetical protein